MKILGKVKKASGGPGPESLLFVQSKAADGLDWDFAVCELLS